jgi:RimJ/RimL family protein N-acetyltransferase
MGSLGLAHAALPPARVSYVSPLPSAWIPHLWEWLQEAPAANFDDYAPRTRTAFRDAFLARLTVERTWGVRLEGSPVGVIAYVPITARLGTFHGICFTQHVCGTGVAREAVSYVLEQLWASGVEKVCASFFADNGRVHRFFAKLGARDEGTQRAQTIRYGEPLDLSLVAVFNPAFVLTERG